MSLFALARAALAGAVLSVLVPHLSPDGRGSPADAHTHEAGQLRIIHPHAPATPRGARSAAGYMRIENRGREADRLVAVEAPVSQRVELHRTVREGNVMRMRPAAGGIAVPAGGAVELAPGGLHVMFIGLSAPLVEGGRFDGVLVFEKAGRVPVTFMIDPAGKGGHHAH